MTFPDLKMDPESILGSRGKSRSEGPTPTRLIQIYSPPPGKPAELPLFCRAAVANARLLHPSFDYILFGRAEMESFVAAEFPQLQDVMASFPFPIQRFDFFRYLAVYRLGGYYLDLDVFLAHSLEPLLNVGCVFPFEELTISDFLREEYGMDWEIANYWFGAAPGDPFIGAIIVNCVRGLQDPKWAGQMLRGIPRIFRQPFLAPVTTGPGMVSRTLAANPDLARDVTILFPNDVCEEACWQQIGDFGVHVMQGSWRKREGFLISKLRRMWETRKRKSQLTESRRKGPRRVGPWREFAHLSTAVKTG